MFQISDQDPLAKYCLKALVTATDLSFFNHRSSFLQVFRSSVQDDADSLSCVDVRCRTLWPKRQISWTRVQDVFKSLLQRQQTSDDEDDLISCHCLYTTKQFYGFGKAIPSLAIANTF
jgi:hypothetical protein